MRSRTSSSAPRRSASRASSSIRARIRAPGPRWACRASRTRCARRSGGRAAIACASRSRTPPGPAACWGARSRSWARSSTGPAARGAWASASTPATSSWAATTCARRRATPRRWRNARGWWGWSACWPSISTTPRRPSARDWTATSTSAAGSWACGRFACCCATRAFATCRRCWKRQGAGADRRLAESRHAPALAAPGYRELVTPTRRQSGRTGHTEHLGEIGAQMFWPKPTSRSL